MQRKTLSSLLNVIIFENPNLKEAPNFLSSSGKRGGESRTVYNFIVQWCTLLGNQRILICLVMAIRYKATIHYVCRKIHNYLIIFSVFGS